ncbi:putative DNA-binding protein [Oceanobacillus halophilus]|uniref:UPF0122 protein D8M06_01235 n=1 Tax=Oceanobacillus halophilus TaxID=930130 RepID=A0A495ABR3_9BACI|nr:putative DNA-binding protein [Oceanobacillus halophilus]RKQ37457.1 putative DNA-binding protein [Oceanobacillus halophilus]
MIEKTTRMNYLFDFYQALLTSKQRNYMELYYLEDYSLGEISELYQVSRQAVYDNIKRTENMLESYEDKLRLYDKYLKQASIIKQLEMEITDKNLLSLIQQLKEID